MKIVQDVYDIPADIVTKLATGEYRRIGSVIRYAIGPNKGQIVKHLKPVDLKTAEQAQGLGFKALQFVKQHKKGTIITATGAVAISIGVWTYNKVRNKEPKVVTEFRAALKVYIEAIRKGNMDLDKINDLMDALEKLKQNKDYEKINIQFTTDELEVLVGRIYKYTIKLANDNQVELEEEELHIPNEKNAGAIINLQTYLNFQKRIFEATA